MDLITKIFRCYLMAFQKCFNYSDSTMRHEFNYFILVFSVIYFILFLIGFYSIIIVSVSNPNMAPVSFGIFTGLILLYCVVHLLPSLSLLYRRIKDVFSKKSRLVFGLYIAIWLLQIIGWVTCFSLSSTISPTNQPTPIFFIFWIGGAIVCQICGLIMFGFFIFLMCKKGNL